MDKTRDRILEHRCVSGILHVTIDNALLHSLKFNEHVKVHIVFDAESLVEEDNSKQSYDPSSKSLSRESMEFSDFKDEMIPGHVGQIPNYLEKVTSVNLCSNRIDCLHSDHIQNEKSVKTKKCNLGSSSQQIHSRMSSDDNADDDDLESLNSHEPHIDNDDKHSIFDIASKSVADGDDRDIMAVDYRDCDDDDDDDDDDDVVETEPVDTCVAEDTDCPGDLIRVKCEPIDDICPKRTSISTRSEPIDDICPKRTSISTRSEPIDDICPKRTSISVWSGKVSTKRTAKKSGIQNGVLSSSKMCVRRKSERQKKLKNIFSPDSNSTKSAQKVVVKFKSTSTISSTKILSGKPKDMTKKIPSEETKDRKIVCQYCSQSFETKEDLLNHHTVTKGEFSCDKCQQVFDYKAHLMAHTISDHGEGESKKSASKGFMCSQCGTVLDRKTTMKSHMMRHTGEYWHKCCICKFRCRHRRDLTSHFKMHRTSLTSTSAIDKLTPLSDSDVKHKNAGNKSPVFNANKILHPQAADYNTKEINSQGSKLACQYCCQTFHSSHERRAHHTNEGNEIGCDKCAAVFDFKAHLMVHDVLVHNDENSECGKSISENRCSSDENTHDNDKDSNQKRSGAKLFKCNLCGQKMVKLYRFKSHMMIHTGEYLLKCCLCSYQCRLDKSLTDHLIKHSKDGNSYIRKCSTSTESNVVTEQVLDSHSHDSHDNENCNVQEALQIEPCKPPSTSTKKESTLSSQSQTQGHHSSQHSPAVMNSPINEIRKDLKFHCQFCSQNFNLNSEMLDHHNLPLQEFSCEKCSKTFKYKAHLLVHEIMFHNDESNPPSKNARGVKVYKCSGCDRTFPRRHHFDNHMMLHTNEYIWQCCVCNTNFRHHKAFVQHLARHIRINVDESERRIKPAISTESLQGHEDENLTDDLQKSGLSSSTSHPSTIEQSTENEPQSNSNVKVEGTSDANKEFCQWCSKYFNSVEAVQAHHCVNMQIPCDKCNQVFECKAYLMVHNMFCGEQSSSSSGHGVISTIQSAAYPCSECGLLMKTMKNLKQHMVIHTDELIHRCCVCYSLFPNARRLKIHLERHTSDASNSTGCKFQCQFCKKCFASMGEVNSHRLKVHKFKCDLCNLTFSLNSARNSHYKTAHEKELIECPECGKVYCSPESFTLHQRYHKFKKKTQCPICGIVMLKAGFSRHMRNHSDKDSGSDFACDKCPKKYHTKSSLIAHIKRYHSGKPYETCDICFKRLINRHGLMRHYTRMHLNDKQYVCEICGKACNRKDNLRIHMKVHEKLSPLHYRCSHCNLSFTTKDAFNKHNIEHDHSTVAACEALERELQPHEFHDMCDPVPVTTAEEIIYYSSNEWPIIAEVPSA